MLEKYPDVLNVKEVCTILRISRKTVYALMRTILFSASIGKKMQVKALL